MSNAFTERENKIMAKAWQCFQEPPKIDYEKLATLCGFTNVGSASNAWSAIKKKLAAQASETDATFPISSPTPKATPRKRTKKAKAESDDDAVDSPMKKAKANRPRTPKKSKVEQGEVEKSMAMVKNEAEGDDDGDEALH